MIRRLIVLAVAFAALAGCSVLHKSPPAATQAAAPALAPLPPLSGNAAAPQRINGSVGAPETAPAPQTIYGAEPPPAAFPAAAAMHGGSAAPIPHPNVRETANGDVALDFADTELREVVAQVLGAELHENYTVDPAVKGTVTIHTQPLPRGRLLSALQVLLGQNAAALVQVGGLYRVMPIAEAGTAAVAAGDSTGGSVVLPLRYTSADALAKLLTPFAANGVKIGADPGRNALVIGGDPNTRGALVTLAQSFDVDALAGQSYALLPVAGSDPKDFASAMQDAFRSQNGGALAGLVRVVPLERLSSVLVVAANARYVDEARRVFELIEKGRRLTERSWHVYYLQNSHADDVAYLLQQAFTPKNVTAQPTVAGQNAHSGGSASTGGSVSLAQGGLGGGGGGATASGLGGSGSSLSGGLGGGLGGSQAASGASEGAGARPAASAGSASSSANPLLGGLEGGGDVDTNAMRIIPNPQNNAVLIYSTQQEEGAVEAMLRKVDILPLQVRIDAVIAEVTLNDQLQYGTQFLFKGSSLTQAMSGAATGGITATLFSGKGISETLAALQNITTVDVLSSPQLLVLDNQTAQLQVGALVPYLSQTSQSTLVSGSPVVNSIQYQQTGVIMNVTPRVNSGGLVTLDIAQEVSDVNTAVTTSGLNSPTFDERRVTSHVVVQDGQTIGLAGLIQDSRTKGNEGIPWAKDIPLLGFLAGQQSNTRTRTELLVLITPHVIHDQRDARALTEDLREQLPSAAAVPQTLKNLPLSGSSDPNAALRQKLNIGP